MQDPKKSFFDEEKESEGIHATEPTPDADGEETEVRMPHAATDPLPLRDNGENLATVSMVLGIASLLCCGLPASIGAIITAILARHYMGKFNGASLAGLVIGIVNILFTAVVVVLINVVMALIEDAIGEGTGSSLLFLPLLH